MGVLEEEGLVTHAHDGDVLDMVVKALRLVFCVLRCHDGRVLKLMLVQKDQ